jgi:hypothetical protein
MFAVEKVKGKFECIHPLHTAEINPHMPWRPGGFMKGIDSAKLTKIVFGGFRAKLIEA